jgi:hypothetical protein
MAMATSDCLVCGRPYAYYDAVPQHFCSVACEIDAGPVGSQIRAVSVKRGRAAKTARAVVDVESAVPRPATGKKDDE